jgi:aryl-alcohol dehydrogenase-like predicted oxidoreductase
MEYLAHQDIACPDIGIGCYALAGVHGPVDQEGYQTAVQRASELGLNFLETAKATNDGRVRRI